MAFIPGVVGAASFIQNTQAAASRARKIASDVAIAQGRSYPQDQDYLIFLQANQGNVTRQEYDQRRAQLETPSTAAGRGPVNAQQAASGLFPVEATGQQTTGGFTPTVASPPGSSATNPITAGGIPGVPGGFLGIGLAVAAFLAFRMFRRRK